MVGRKKQPLDQSNDGCTAGERGKTALISYKKWHIFYVRHICCHKPALWETGAVMSLFPGLLTFREALTTTTLLWLIPPSLRGIIPYHKPLDIQA